MAYVQAGYIEGGTGALTTRTINNSGEGFTGTIPSGCAISFALVDADGKPTTGEDATSGHRLVGYSVRATIDPSNGEFSLPLWPTDRSDTPVFYRCRVTVRGLDVLPHVIRPFPSGDGTAMLFSTWQALARWTDITPVSEIVADASATSFTMTDASGNTRTVTIGVDGAGNPYLQIV